MPEQAEPGVTFNPKNWTLLEKMDVIGQARGASISQVALAWILADPLISSPIIGPRNLEQLEDNLGAIGTQLTAEEKQTLDEASDWRS